MTRTTLLLTLAVAASVPIRRALRPIVIDLDRLGDDAPRWLAELTERND